MVLMAVDIEFEQVVQVVGAVIEALRGEVVERIVEGGVDPLASGEPGLGLRDRIRRLLQVEQVRTHARREDDSKTYRYLSGRFAVLAIDLDPWIGVCDRICVQMARKKVWLISRYVFSADACI